MRPPVDSSCYRVLMLRLGKLRLRGTGRKEGLGPGAPPGFLPGRVERDPGRCVVARLLESAHPGVDAGVGKARRELVAQQPVVDAQPRVALPVLPEVVPERVDRLLGALGAQRVGPSLLEEAPVALPALRLAQGALLP